MLMKLKEKLSKDTNFLELFTGSYTAIIFKAISIMLGYILTLIIARWYGAETLGLFALSITILDIFIVIGVLGFDNSLVKFVADYNNNKPYLVKEVYQKSLYIVIPFGLLLSMFLYFNAEFFAISVFGNESLIVFFKFISFSILPSILLLVNATIFRGLKHIAIYSFFQNLGLYLVAILVIVATRGDCDKNIVIISYILAIFFLAIFSFKYIKKYVVSSTINNTLKYKEMLKTSIPMLFTSSMMLVMGWTDVIMLGVFRSEVEVGVYSVVVKLAGIVSLVLVSVSTIAAPKFSEMYSGNDIKGLKELAQSSTKMIFYGSIPIVLILALFPDRILEAFGEGFEVGAFTLWILILGQLINAACGPVGYILNMSEGHNVYYFISSISAIINMVLNYSLVNAYGLNGVAFATTISLIFLNISSVLYIRYKYGFLTIRV